MDVLGEKPSQDQFPGLAQFGTFRQPGEGEGGEKSGNDDFQPRFFQNRPVRNPYKPPDSGSLPAPPGKSFVMRSFIRTRFLPPIPSENTLDELILLETSIYISAFLTAWKSDSNTYDCKFCYLQQQLTVFRWRRYEWLLLWNGLDVACSAPSASF